MSDRKIIDTVEINFIRKENDDRIEIKQFLWYGHLQKVSEKNGPKYEKKEIYI